MDVHVAPTHVFSVPLERQGDDELTLTDVYGGRITKRLSHNLYQSLHTTPDQDAESEIQLVRRLQGSLELPKKIDEITKEKDEQVTLLTYAETLHKGLKIMWVPMVYLGRMPFRLILKNNRASIVVKKMSTAYIACFGTCVITWIAFVWVTIGILVLVGGATSQNDKPNLLSEYWSDIFIFWTTLLQACVSTTHILYQADDFALFIKAWYRVLDITKIEVSRTLKQYIICSQIALILFIIGMIVMFYLPNMFSLIRGTAILIVAAFCEPVNVIIHQRNKKAIARNIHVDSYDKFAAIGLLVYVIAIVFSWMYIMQFMVFCRCFRKGLKCINERIAMILNVDDVQRVGPNALRLTYEYIHKDYLGIATTGIKIGRIFSWTICNYYLWAILVIVVELGEIFRFAKVDFRKEPQTGQNHLLETKPGDVPFPIQSFLNEFIHFLVTAVCICYVSYEGSGAHKEGKMSYELARYRGLVDCTTQLERNFVRSIWIIVSEKCPVHVAPGKFFGINNSTIMTVFATAFTYFIFWAQSQNHF